MSTNKGTKLAPVRSGPLLSPKERYARGQALRKQMARGGHAVWEPARNRKCPLDLLAASTEGRLPKLLKIKRERMAASPFGFFRGAVAVMAADLAAMPHSGIVNQICGDAHVLNLGAFAAPDGRLVFDINDFDESNRAPFEWDAKRLAASLVLAGRQVGVKDHACREAVRLFIASYRKMVHCLADLTILELAHFQVHRLGRIQPVSEALQKAQTATPQASLDKLTKPAGKKARVFRDEPPLLKRVTGAEARGVLAGLKQYGANLLPERRHFIEQYRPIDVGFKVVGTGSVGLRDYVVYLEGNGPGDPLFLQIKEETHSAWSPYFRDRRAPAHNGQRTAEGQRAMQFLSDPYLAWTTIGKRDYLVRQLNDHKAAISLDALAGDGLNEYAELCGEVLARGHARSGDAHLLSGYVGTSDKLDDAVAAFADAYADQTEKDWKLLVDARKSRKKK